MFMQFLEYELLIDSASKIAQKILPFLLLFITTKMIIVAKKKKNKKYVRKSAHG